jgi:hypothetical protein
MPFTLIENLLDPVIVAAHELHTLHNGPALTIGYEIFQLFLRFEST